ncbi:hypothetical protein LTR86_000266 [Recurvomyces mirabilis]|nr:hypothetical protein LTR86_000266 [Recurvomyces mirabilis]
MGAGAPEAKQQGQGKKQQVCRFFNTKNEVKGTTETTSTEPEPTGKVVSDVHSVQPASQADSQSSIPSPVPVRPSNVVLRPTPQAQQEDPRAFQIGQVQRRFRPRSSEKDDSSILEFGLKPSDPDFPYEIEELQCILTVPKAYPAVKASLKITNQDIPRGFQLNIERGFNMITSANASATLLGLMNRLDRELEIILAGKMADTIKIVSNRGAVVADRLPPVPAVPAVAAPAPVVKSLPSFTDKERAAAKSKRDTHTRQLTARFGRLQAFSASSDGRTYTLPLDSPRRTKWPSSLQILRSFRLLVPEAYPLEPATIKLDSDAQEARNVEEAFKQLPQSMNEPTLTQLANHLAQHIADMAVQEAKSASHVTPPSAPPATVEATPAVSVSSEPTTTSHHAMLSSSADKPHLHVIPRPPEWSQVHNDGEDSAESADDTYSEASDSEDDAQDEDQADESKALDTSSTTQERGVLLSFPHIELHGIELLELTSLNISVKCERCKDITDVQKLRNYSGKATDMQQVTCKKCANVLAVGFRTELMHVNAARAGYLDLEGCTVVDMLPR